MEQRENIYPDLSAEEKNIIFASRKFCGEDAEDLNSILNNCMKLVSSNILGSSIVTGAKYGEKTTENNFTIEDIYIGNRGRVKGGHCGLISAINDDKNPRNARGEIYINEDFIRGIKSELGVENSTIYLSNIIVHEFLHGNQRIEAEKVAPNKIDNSRSGLVAPSVKGEKTKPSPEEKYKDVQDNKEGYARMMLTEAASMTAGLTVCMQLCDEHNREAIMRHALQDIRDNGNVSETAIQKLEKALNERPQTTAEQQRHSLHLFKILVNGEMEYLRDNCGGRPLNITFKDNEHSLNLSYNESLFGDRNSFDRAIKFIDEFNKTRENPISKNPKQQQVDTPQNKENNQQEAILNLAIFANQSRRIV